MFDIDGFVVFEDFLFVVLDIDLFCDFDNCVFYVLLGVVIVEWVFVQKIILFKYNVWKIGDFIDLDINVFNNYFCFLFWGY